MHDTIGTRRVTWEADRRIGRGDEIRGRGEIKTVIRRASPHSKYIN